MAKRRSPSADDLPDTGALNREHEQQFAALMAAMHPKTEESANLLRLLSTMTDANSALAMLNDKAATLNHDQSYWNAGFGQRLGQIYRLLDSRLPVVDKRGKSNEWEGWRTVGRDMAQLRKALTQGVEATTRGLSGNEAALMRVTEQLDRAVSCIAQVTRRGTDGAPTRNMAASQGSRRDMYAQLQANASLHDLAKSNDAIRELIKLESEANRVHLTRLSRDQLDTFVKVMRPVATEEYRSKMLTVAKDSNYLTKNIRDLLKNEVMPQLKSKGSGSGIGNPLDLLSRGKNASTAAKTAGAAAGGAAKATSALSKGAAATAGVAASSAAAAKAAAAAKGTDVAVKGAAATADAAKYRPIAKLDTATGKMVASTSTIAAPKAAVPVTAPAPTGLDAIKAKAGDIVAKSKGWLDTKFGSAPAPATTGAVVADAGKSAGTASKAAGFLKGGKLPGALALAGGALEAYDVSQDTTKTQSEKNRNYASVAAGTAGGMGGATAGALAGAAVGSVVPVVGTLIGGALGGILGGMAGSSVAKSGANALLGLDDAGYDKKRALPPAGQQKLVSASDVPANQTKTTALNGVNPTASAQATPQSGDLLHTAAQAGATKTSVQKAVNAAQQAQTDGLSKNSQAQAAIREMQRAPTTSGFGTISREQMAQLFAPSQADKGSYNDQLSKVAVAAVAERNGLQTVPYLAPPRTPQTVQAAYIPAQQSSFAPPVSYNTSRNVQGLVHGGGLAAGATAVTAALTGSSAAQARPLPVAGVSSLEAKRQAETLAQPLQGLRNDMSTQMSGFRTEQSALAKQANDDQSSFFSKTVGMLIPAVGVIQKASEFITDPKRFLEKGKAALGDLVDAAKSGANSAINIFRGTNGERNVGKADNRSLWEKTKDAVSGGWNAAKNTFNSAPTASSGMMDFTFKHEAGKAGYAALNKNDVGGIAYGKVQFNSRTGKLGNVIDDYLANGDKTSANYQTIAKYRDAIKGNNMGVLSQATDLHAALKGAGNEDAMKKAQDKVIMQEYGNPALRAGQNAGLKSLASQQVLFDTNINGGMDAVMAATKNKLGGKVGDTVNGRQIGEKEFLHEFVNQRKQRLLTLADNAEAKGKSKDAKDLRAVAGSRLDELHGLIDKNSDVLGNAKTGGVSVTPNGKVATTTGGALDPNSAHRYDGDVQGVRPNSGGYASGLIKGANESLMNSTQKAIDKGVKYSFSSKNSASGGIDCSGWVAEINKGMMDNINQTAGKEVFSKKDKALFNDSSEGIIKNVGKATGAILNNDQLKQTGLKEGMVIGMDTGPKGFDAGREMGIDHVVNVVKDPKTGQLMVSESRGGKGVTMTPAEQWQAAQDRKGTKLFGVDPMALADKDRAAALQAATGKPGTPAPQTAGQQYANNPGAPTVPQTAGQQYANNPGVLAGAPGTGVPTPLGQLPTATATTGPGGLPVPTAGDQSPGGMLVQAGVMLQAAANALLAVAGKGPLNPDDKTKPTEPTTPTEPAAAQPAGSYGNPLVVPEVKSEILFGKPEKVEKDVTDADTAKEKADKDDKDKPKSKMLFGKSKDLADADEPEYDETTEVFEEELELSETNKAKMRREVTTRTPRVKSASDTDEDDKTAGLDTATTSMTTPTPVPIDATATTPDATAPTTPLSSILFGQSAGLPGITVAGQPGVSAQPNGMQRTTFGQYPMAAPATVGGVLGTVGNMVRGVTNPLSNIMRISGNNDAANALGQMGNLSTQSLFGSNLPVAAGYEFSRRLGNLPLTTDANALGTWLAPETMNASRQLAGELSRYGMSPEGAQMPMSSPSYNPGAVYANNPGSLASLGVTGFNPNSSYSYGASTASYPGSYNYGMGSAGSGYANNPGQMAGGYNGGYGGGNFQFGNYSGPAGSATQRAASMTGSVINTAGGVTRDLNAIGSILGTQIVPDKIANLTRMGVPTLPGLVQGAIGANPKLRGAMEISNNANAILGAFGADFRLPGMGDVMQTATAASDAVLQPLFGGNQTALPKSALPNNLPTPASVLGVNAAQGVGQGAAVLDGGNYTPGRSVNPSVSAPLPPSQQDISALTDAVATRDQPNKDSTAPTVMPRPGGTTGQVSIDECSLMLDESLDRLLRA